MTVIRAEIGGKLYQVFGEMMFIQCSDEKMEKIMQAALQWIRSRTLGWLIMHSVATFDNDISVNTFTELTELNSQLEEPLEKLTLEVDFALRNAFLRFYLQA